MPTAESTWTFTKGAHPVTYAVTIPLLTAADFPAGDVADDELCIAGTVAVAAQLAIAHAALREEAPTPEILRFARKTLGLTRDALAAELEMAPNVVEAIEDGSWIITASYVGRMQALLARSDRGGFVARRVP